MSEIKNKSRQQEADGRHEDRGQGRSVVQSEIVRGSFLQSLILRSPVQCVDVSRPGLGGMNAAKNGSAVSHAAQEALLLRPTCTRSVVADLHETRLVSGTVLQAWGQRSSAGREGKSFSRARVPITASNKLRYTFRTSTTLEPHLWLKR